MKILMINKLVGGFSKFLQVVFVCKDNVLGIIILVKFLDCFEEDNLCIDFDENLIEFYVVDFFDLEIGQKELI